MVLFALISKKGKPMKKYKAIFRGREAGAIGIFYSIYAEVEAENKKAAELKLYEKYEHITRLDLREVDAF